MQYYTAGHWVYDQKATYVKVKEEQESSGLTTII